MLDRINKITTIQASIIIAVIGLATFFSGLLNPFLGDDFTQIVNNIPVHSITNIRIFFEGGTFYKNQGLAPLYGVWYRPLMTTTFSFIYTLFGAHPFYYHVFQLLLYILCAILVFLVFRYFFKPALALFLALIFLVHPINSQIVYTIPSMQEVLFFFFGILAIWLLLRFSSVKSLIAVAFCLFLSLLSKETAIAFIAMGLLYLFWFNRKRIFPFIGIMLLPIALYLALKINAVGLIGNPKTIPMDFLKLSGRLYTVPSIILFYLTKFIFPLKLANSYYWTYPTISLRHVILPLVIVAALLALIVYIGTILHKKLPRDQFLIYLFFTSWAIIGLIPNLQIAPLDMTACQNWFYFSMVGVLGMFGFLLAIYLPKLPKIKALWLLIIAILLIGVLGFRSAIRGHDYRNLDSIANTDVAVSKENYILYSNMSVDLIALHEYSDALGYAEWAAQYYPSYIHYNNLAVALNGLGDYSGAMQAYEQALKYNQDDNLVYEEIGGLTLLTGNPNSNKQFLLDSLQKFPRDSTLWMYLAILEDKYNDNVDARIAISNAARYGQINQSLYAAIMSDKPFTLDLVNIKQSITIK